MDDDQRLAELLARGHRYARRRCQGRPSLTDAATDAATDALLRARAEYQPHRGPFDSWAWVLIRSAVRDVLRQRHARPVALALTDTASPDPPPSLPWPASVLQKLTPAERQVIHLRYVKGYSIADIGRIRWTTRQAASNVHQRALRRLREIAASG